MSSDCGWEEEVEPPVTYVPSDSHSVSENQPNFSRGRRGRGSTNREYRPNTGRQWEQSGGFHRQDSQQENFEQRRNEPQSSRQNDEPAFIDWSSLVKAMEENEQKAFAHLPKVVKLTYQECDEVKRLTRAEVDAIRSSKNKISVTSLDDKEPPNVPNPVTEFIHAFGPYPEVMKIIEAQGFKNPSPIQCQLWPLLMSGYDMVGIAQTGTGKTLAFLMPGLLHIEAQQEFLKDPDRKGPLCLIIAPTRELAQQIQDEVTKFKYKGIRSVCVYGQGSYANQCKALRSGVEIVVATPGRLIDFVQKEIVNLQGVSYLVLDEADRMLDMGFQPDIIKITCGIRKDRQTVLTSATWPFDVEYIAKRLMKDPLKVRVGDLDLAAVTTVTQKVLVCEEEEKIDLLVETLQELTVEDKVIIFANRKSMVDHLAVLLLDYNIDSRVMHGGVEQSDREAALEELKNGSCRILIATDVASRGLDVADLTLVINLDLPKNLEEYVHRSGRTGRAGRSGEVLSYVTWGNRNQAQELIDILQRSNQDITPELQRLADRAKKFNENRPQGSSGGGGRGGRPRGGRSRW